MYELYAAPGSCSRVPLIALEEAQANYDVKLIRFMRGDHKQADYLALNPKGKVPCLVTAHGAITENVAIARYLAANHDGLLPKTKNPFEDAQVTSDLAFCSSTLHPIVSRMRVPMFMATGADAIASVKEKAMEAMEPLAAVVEERLSRGEWWYDSGWSILDAYVFWVGYRITGGGFQMDKYPRWAAHSQRMNARPSIVRAMAHEAELQATLEAEGLAPKMG